MPNAEFWGILVTITALFGWVIKKVIDYFIKAADNKISWIEKLVADNQTNVENFTNTVNHQRTEDRKIQATHIEALNNLACEIKNSSIVNEKLFNFIINNKNGQN
jgi:hypothetical protein